MSTLSVTTITSANGTTDLTLSSGNTTAGQMVVLSNGAGVVLKSNATSTSLGVYSNGTMTLTGNLVASNISFGTNTSFAANVGIGTANPAVTLDMSAKTDSILLPIGNTANRNILTSNGQLRFNNDVARKEYCTAGFWINEQNGYTQVTGKTRVAFQYTGALQSWTIPSNVNYIFVKLWGAGGGGGSYGSWRQGATGGGGGYSEGIVPVVPGQTLYIRVGQNGYARWSSNKAYPDGGASSTSTGDNQYCGAGGGSTSIATPNVNANNWCMYAGGGGGGGSVNGWGRNPGGAGGGLTGEDGFTELTSYTPYAYVGKAGTQSAGGAGGTGGTAVGGAGSANQGGTTQNGNSYGGGGGGGYYGGGSGSYAGSSMAGGGGGSGYIHPSIIRGVTLTGIREYPAMPNDPDAIAYSLNGINRIGVGGDEGSNGGYGLAIVYY